jgi:uncharacterized membrane protein YidH (DUF202 family)
LLEKGESALLGPLSWPKIKRALSFSRADDPERDLEKEQLLRDEKNMLTAMERFSRLTTDLANERTLLAWVRTCLAALRTAFAFLKISGTTTLWGMSVFFGQCAIVTLVLLLCGTGYLRYSAIKHAINTKLPPEKFGRLTVKYMYSVLSVASVAIAMGMYTKHYVRA